MEAVNDRRGCIGMRSTIARVASGCGHRSQGERTQEIAACHCSRFGATLIDRRLHLSTVSLEMIHCLLGAVVAPVIEEVDENRQSDPALLARLACACGGVPASPMGPPLILGAHHVQLHRSNKQQVGTLAYRRSPIALLLAACCLLLSSLADLLGTKSRILHL